VQRHLAERIDAGQAAIFHSHIALLRDPQFIAPMEQVLRTSPLSAEAAVARVVSDLHNQFLSQPIPLLQDKAADVLDIGRRLVHGLRSSLREGEVVPDAGRIIVAHSLTPSQLVRFARQGIAGVVVEACGPRSHTAILARSLGIPLVAGLPDISGTIAEGTPVLVDADTGRVTIDPAVDELRDWHGSSSPNRRSVEPDFIPQPAVTPDGVTCQVLLNLSDPVEAPTVSLLGADGVGLFRTEFYYMGCANWPTAEESYQVYRQVASELGDLPLHIRLVDFGADKFPPYAEFPFSRNPSLGLRGIRLLLAREDILRPQVQALARLGRERELTVLIPMLDSLDTLHETTRRLCQICGCSERSQLPFRLGAMIEVPLAALQIRQILPHVDAVSIGLNDLTQYLLAADRDDTFVERYHDAMQPAVLRLVAEVITAAREAFCPVTVCGELAGDPKLTGLLLALGLRSFSVSRASYKAVLDAICHLSIRGVREFADRLPELATAGEVREWVQRNLLPPTP
jgi:phosphotransferase system enzyme I (PtsI)